MTFGPPDSLTRLRLPTSLAGAALAFALCRADLAHAFADLDAAVAPGGWLALSGVAIAGGVAALGTAALLSRRLKGPRRSDPPRPLDLAEAKWRLEFALDAAGLGFWDLDLVTHELRCDARARALYALPEQAMHSAADWRARVHPADRAAAIEQGRRALVTDQPSLLEYRIVAPDGETRWVEDIARGFERSDGERRLVGLVRDITERRAAAEELGWRQRRAQESAQEKARFLAVMSHEIRTPMTGILGMLDLLSGEPDAESRHERLGIARRSARSLITILNDVLTFSRLEASEFELRPGPMRPRRLVSEIMALMAPKAEAKGIALRWTIAPETPEWVLADANRTRQVLLNLVSNAIKFTEQGHVATRVEFLGTNVPEAMGLRFEVRDTGGGIDPELLGRVFDSFVRDENGAEGTGLGLAISKHLTQLMGGAIEMTSAPGAGTRARFDIPVSAVREPPPEPARAAPGGTGAAPAGPMRILVAEDNSTNQYLLRALLEREGHQVTTVADGREAVRAAKAGNFDVILMDVQMPVMDGAAAAREIRASGLGCADTPIIALTANALASDRQVYLAAGMNDYVPKPIEFDRLSRALTRVAQAPGGRPKAVE